MDQRWSKKKVARRFFCSGLELYKMARLFLSKKHVDKIFPKFAQARGGAGHSHFVGRLSCIAIL